MNHFTCPAFGFRIAQPDGWEVLPAQWVHAYLSRAAPTSEALADILQQAQAHEPFLLMHKPAENPVLAMPTVQCKASRLPAMTAQGSMANLLESITEKMTAAFPDFDILDASDEYLVAGTCGGRMVASMSVKNAEGQSFHCISESLFLPAKRFLFMIGMSATSDAGSRPEADFREMVHSLRLDQISHK